MMSPEQKQCLLLIVVILVVWYLWNHYSSEGFTDFWSAKPPQRWGQWIYARNGYHPTVPSIVRDNRYYILRDMAYGPGRKDDIYCTKKIQEINQEQDEKHFGPQTYGPAVENVHPMSEENVPSLPPMMMPQEEIHPVMTESMHAHGVSDWLHHFSWRELLVVVILIALIYYAYEQQQ